MIRIRQGAIAADPPTTVTFVFAGSAQAAVQVGSNLTASVFTGPAVNVSSTQNTAPTGAPFPVASPLSGVIVSILVKHGTSGADPGTYGFRVLSGSPTTFSTNGPPAELPDFTWPANETAGIRGFTPSLGGVNKGIPIAAGQRLGVVRSTGTSGQGAQFWSNSSSGGALGSSFGIHNSGSQSYLSMSDFEQLIQYNVEPDADHDGFGDETQDKCQPPTPPPTAPALPRWPRRRRRSARKRRRATTRRRSPRRSARSTSSTARTGDIARRRQGSHRAAPVSMTG